MYNVLIAGAFGFIETSTFCDGCLLDCPFWTISGKCFKKLHKKNHCLLSFIMCYNFIK